MKRLTITALLAGQLAAVAPPAVAAELSEVRTQEMGAFGGVRLRVPLDGGATGDRQIRAGLAVAPTLQVRDITGASRTRIGEGLELGFNGDDRLRLSLAGEDVSRLGAAQDNENEDEEDDRGGGPSTLGWVAIGVGAVLVTGAGLWALCFSGTICNLDDD
jgi:hypothetical protein